MVAQQLQGHAPVVAHGGHGRVQFQGGIVIGHGPLQVAGITPHLGPLKEEVGLVARKLNGPLQVGKGLGRIPQCPVGHPPVVVGERELGRKTDGRGKGLQGFCRPAQADQRHTAQVVRQGVLRIRGQNAFGDHQGG